MLLYSIALKINYSYNQLLLPIINCSYIQLLIYSTAHVFNCSYIQLFLYSSVLVFNCFQTWLFFYLTVSEITIKSKIFRCTMLWTSCSNPEFRVWRDFSDRTEPETFVPDSAKCRTRINSAFWLQWPDQVSKFINKL